MVGIRTNTVYHFFNLEGGSTVSTSLVYHAFGIAGYHCTNAEYKSGQVVFHIEPGDHPLRCPCCNSTNVILRGQKHRCFHAAPIGNKAVFIVLTLPRVGCRDCGTVRQIKVSFAALRRSFTRAFERYALDLFDHFHVVKLFNDKLSEFRRDLQRDADKIEKHVLKGTRWLLLKNPKNLDDERDERQRLDAALKINQPLATVYYMKEDLRQFWTQPNY